jgi:CheY-like chemotaxis protein
MPQVLIVDDNPDIRRTVRWVLELAADDVEYIVAEAGHGREALDILRGGTTATIVLFDLSMPVMDGQQMLQHILADPPLAARCELVCMTATEFTLTPDLAALLATYSIPVLAKPFDIDDLLAVVAAAAYKLAV